MSKLTKISFALLIALFLTSAVEAIFIFVYKPTQPTPPPPSSISEILPSPVTSPTPSVALAVNPKIIDYLKIWQYSPNTKLSLKSDLIGTISAVFIENDPNKGSSIYFQSTGQQDAIAHFKFFPKDYGSIKIFKEDNNGDQIFTSLKELSVGDHVIINQIYGAGKPTLDNPDLIIYITK